MTEDQDRVEEAKRAVGIGTDFEMAEGRAADPWDRELEYIKLQCLAIVKEADKGLRTGFVHPAYMKEKVDKMDRSVGTLEPRRPEQGTKCPECGSTRVLGLGTHEVTCADCGYLLGVDD